MWTLLKLFLQFTFQIVKRFHPLLAKFCYWLILTYKIVLINFWYFYKILTKNWLFRWPKSVIFTLGPHQRHKGGILYPTHLLLVHAIRPSVRPAFVNAVTFDLNKYGCPSSHHRCISSRRRSSSEVGNASWVKGQMESNKAALMHPYIQSYSVRVQR